MINTIISFSGKYRFLSNFYDFPIEVNGILYPTSEHAYQAQKTLSLSERNHIAKLKTPGLAKRYGQKVTLRPHWDTVRIPVMFNILQIKFADEKLSSKLLNTNDAVLVEENAWGNRFWGAVYEKNDWCGQNHLGVLLMHIRQEKQVYGSLHS